MADQRLDAVEDALEAEAKLLLLLEARGVLADLGGPGDLVQAREGGFVNQLSQEGLEAPGSPCIVALSSPAASWLYRHRTAA